MTAKHYPMISPNAYTPGAEVVAEADDGQLTKWRTIDLSPSPTNHGCAWAVMCDGDLMDEGTMTAVALIKWSHKAGAWFCPRSQPVEWNRLQSITWLQFREKIGAA